MKAKTRLVNFRVTEEEYQYLLMACSRRGARSLSDFARAAVFQSAGPQEQTVGYLQGQVAMVDRRVLELEASIKRVISLLNGGERLAPALATHNQQE